MAYNVHEIIKKYTLPVKRGNQSVREFLEQYYETLKKDLEECVPKRSYPNEFSDKFYKVISSHINKIIEKECNMILEILRLEEENQQILKLKKFNELMHYMYNKGAFRILKISGGVMLRIRASKEILDDRKELFHIPYNKKHLCSPQRFSVYDSPCLYLSVCRGLTISGTREMLELAWMECGMPREYSVALFEIQESEGLNLLHFGKSGEAYLKEYENTREENKHECLRKIIEYLLSFPLRAACFIGVEDKQKAAKCYEEYLFPQLLMEWTKESTLMDGISYESALTIPEARKLYAYNVALPLKVPDEKDGFDVSLKKIFKLSKPKKIDLSKNIAAMAEFINDLNTYSNDIEERLKRAGAEQTHPYYYLVELCNSLNTIYLEILDGKKESILEEFEELCVLQEKVKDVNKTIKDAMTAEEWIIKNNQHGSNKVLTEDDYQYVLKRFNELSIVYTYMRNIFSVAEINGVFPGADGYRYIDE